MTNAWRTKGRSRSNPAAPHCSLQLECAHRNSGLQPDPFHRSLILLFHLHLLDPV